MWYPIWRIPGLLWPDRTQREENTPNLKGQLNTASKEQRLCLKHMGVQGWHPRLSLSPPLTQGVMLGSTSCPAKDLHSSMQLARGCISREQKFQHASVHHPVKWWPAMKHDKGNSREGRLVCSWLVGLNKKFIIHACAHASTHTHFHAQCLPPILLGCPRMTVHWFSKRSQARWCLV